MRVSAQAFWAPKYGNQESEYEDAFWPRQEIIGKPGSTFRFAVSDGATETSFSGVWAKQLARAFCKGDLDNPKFATRLRTLRERWLKIVSRKSLPWYAEEKLRAGAFAALAGLVLTESPEDPRQGIWTAMAIGDSCIMHLRGSELIGSFPIQSSDQFGNSPILLSSIQRENETERQLADHGIWYREDTFYLMTDAIACWFLRRVESGDVPAGDLQNLSSGKHANFESWLGMVRQSKLIRNDDVTIMRVEIEKFD